MSASHPSKFQNITPILCVADFEASMEYYTKKLGFQRAWDWGKPKSFGCVRRDGIDVFLCLKGQGQPGTWIFVTVQDVDALHAECAATGATIVQPPTDQPWGCRELVVRDPDGHTIRFAQTIRGEPLPVKRVAVEARLEERLANLVADLAKETDRTVGELLEEILLHSFEPVRGLEGEAVASPHALKTFELIDRLKQRHGIDYDTHASYRFVETKRKNK
jgi:catechol 2,3-dioxygenase-like lactoylglutathione lyase family enzyme